MPLQPHTPEERGIWWALAGMWLAYLAGAVYVVGPALGWLLLLLAGCRWLGVGGPKLSLAPAAWLWVGGMLLMEAALVIGHLDAGLGAGQLVKSSIGWAKGWALLAIFVVAGSLSVRLELIARAVCLLCAQTLVIAPLLLLAFFAGLPQDLYVSPLKAVGGPGPEFFTVSLYGINPDNGLPRWRLFTPWAPALGMVANLFFFIAATERNPRWRVAGLAGSVLMILMSGSRLGLLALPAVWIAGHSLRRLREPALHFAAAAGCLAAGLLARPILYLAEDAVARFHAARPESSRVRAALARIGLERWRDEAPIWGHGIVERGPHLVEYMPIGSHHTWYGLLFVKGAVGLLALLIPLVWTLALLIHSAGRNASSACALNVVLVILAYSFGENLEILSYLIWPGLLVVGIALRELHQARQTRPAAGPHEPLHSNGAATCEST